MPLIDVVQGDITAEETDAVVTAANESLMGGGGVVRARAIRRGRGDAVGVVHSGPVAAGEAMVRRRGDDGAGTCVGACGVTGARDNVVS